ncbi:hypothetical protein I5735_18360 [Acinetobacter baumannii]|nr:hypothetical protein [Acinetobacter baumannii]
MPKVKFLSDLCSGQAGSIHDLQDYEANILIKMKVAELVGDNHPVDPVDPVDQVKKGKKSAQKGE